MKHKLIVHYTAVGKAVSDFALESEYQSLLVQLEQRGVNVAYSTGPIFDRIRVGIVRGELSHEKVRFHYKGEVLAPDSDGRLACWPEGFLDINQRFLLELIQGEQS